MATIASALRLSLAAVSQDYTEFEVQLEVRLREVDALAAFRDGLRDHFFPEVLIPETNPLNPAAGPLLFPLKAGFSVAAICVYEEGRKVITGDEEGQLRVWWIDSGIPCLTVDVAPMSFSCCASDPTRPEVVFGTFEKGTIIHLDLETGDIRKRDVSQHGSVVDFSFNPPQDLLLSIHHKRGSGDRENGTLACWSWPSLDLVWKRNFNDDIPSAVRWNKDASAIYLAMWDRLIRMDALGNNQETIRRPPPPEKIDQFDLLDGRTTTRFMALALRTDGTMAVGRDDGRIEILEPDTGFLLRILPGHPLEFYEANISYLSFVGNIELVSAGSDATIRIWNVDSGHELRSFRATTSKIAAMDVFDGGKKAVTGHKMLTANVWNLQASGHAEGEGGSVRSLRVCEALGVAAAIIGYRRARIWNLKNGTIRTLEFDFPIRSVGIDADRGEFIAIVGSEIRSLESEKESPPGCLLHSFYKDYYFEATSSLNGKLFAIDDYSSVVVWRRDCANMQFDLPKSQGIYSMCVSDTNLIVATSNQVRIYDLTRKLNRVRVAKLTESPLTTVLSPNGQTLAVCDKIGTLTGFDVATAKQLWRIETGNPWISSLFLTDSGRLCVVLDDDLSIYDVNSRKRLAHLRSENRWGDCWMPEIGKTVLVGGTEGMLHRLYNNVI